jgi:hypothetical protein
LYLSYFNHIYLVLLRLFFIFLKRFVMDTMLSLQNLLVCLMEADPHCVIGIDVVDSVNAYSSLLRSLPPAGAHGAQTQRRNAVLGGCPILRQILTLNGPAAKGSSVDRSNSSDHLEGQSLPFLLVEILKVEAADFISDLHATDQAINQEQEHAQLSGRRPHPADGSGESSGASPAAAALRSTDAKLARTPDAASNVGAVALPVAELIIAAHTVILIHTLVTSGKEFGSCSCSSKMPELQEKSTSEARVMYEPSNSNHHTLVLSLRSQLPRNSWWLCVRILKAFLALQGQVRVFYLFCLLYSFNLFCASSFLWF